jgi:hypothetical protein
MESSSLRRIIVLTGGTIPTRGCFGYHIKDISERQEQASARFQCTCTASAAYTWVTRLPFLLPSEWQTCHNLLCTWLICEWEENTDLEER